MLYENIIQQLPGKVHEVSGKFSVCENLTKIYYFVVKKLQISLHLCLSWSTVPINGTKIKAADQRIFPSASRQLLSYKLQQYNLRQVNSALLGFLAFIRQEIHDLVIALPALDDRVHDFVALDRIPFIHQFL